MSTYDPTAIAVCTWCNGSGEVATGVGCSDCKGWGEVDPDTSRPARYGWFGGPSHNGAPPLTRSGGTDPVPSPDPWATTEIEWPDMTPDELAGALAARPF